MKAIKATGSAGKEYGHVPGHQYHDVDVTISRTRKGNWTVEILETWGSAQGYDQENGRKKVIGRSEDLRSALNDARQRAKNADIGPDYVEEALSEAEQNATEEIEAQQETEQSIAEGLVAKWIAREREQRKKSGMLDEQGNALSGTAESEATKQCRRELQEAFGLTVPA